MKPLDFYELGLRLTTSAETESERRTAISRLYYGLHHEACCRYFREHSDAPALPGGSRHRRLIDRFHEVADIDVSDIATYLQQLSRIRNVADYELKHPLNFEDRIYTSEQLVELALDAAELLLEALDGYSPGAAPDGCNCLIERR